MQDMQSFLNMRDRKNHNTFHSTRNLKLVLKIVPYVFTDADRLTMATANRSFCQAHEIKNENSNGQVLKYFARKESVSMCLKP